MQWEAVTALSTAFTGVVIALSALAALREVRLGAEHAAAARAQLEQLRVATQFEGALKVFEELDSPMQIEARRYVIFDLPLQLRDETYRKEVAHLGLADETKHQELHVLRCFERIGFYVRKGLVDRDVVYTVASGRIFTMWAALEEVVAIHRAAVGTVWTEFERLEHETREWTKQQGLNAPALEALQRSEILRMREPVE